MYITFLEDWRGYRAGQSADVPNPFATMALDSGAAQHTSKLKREGRLETATRSAPENAAERTEPPEPQVEYTGHGWWKTPHGKVRAGKDADPGDVLSEARDGQ